MRADVGHHRPFKKFLNVEILETTNYLHDAYRLEYKLIKQHYTLGRLGYNTLHAHPPHTKKYHYLKRRKLI